MFGNFSPLVNLKLNRNGSDDLPFNPKIPRLRNDNWGISPCGVGKYISYMII
jgi:hypothetical protein